MDPFQLRILCDGDSVILKNMMVDRGEMQCQGGTDLDFLFFMVSICPSEFLHRGGTSPGPRYLLQKKSLIPMVNVHNLLT